MDILAWSMKYIIFIFNVMCLVCGALLVALGSVIVSDISHLRYFEKTLKTQPVPAILILIGLVICLVSIFGCCGAIQENIFFLGIYAVLMFTLFIIQIAMIFWTFTKVQEFSDAIDKVVDEAWKENDPEPMEALQLSMKCCGVKNYADYAGKPIPNSCCGSLTKHCTPEVYEKREGCRAAFHNFWDKNIGMIRYGGMVVALVELAAYMAACYLRDSINKAQRNRRVTI